MAITVDCNCGKVYRLKDEMAGRLVQCPACQQVLRVETMPLVLQADPIFDRDQFLLRQKFLSLSEKYAVWDEHGNTILYVVRPVYYGRMFMALGAAGATLLLGMFFSAIACSLTEKLSEALALILLVLLMSAALVAAVIVAVVLQHKRHVYFYRDETASEPVLCVLQDRKFMIPTATYTVIDDQGTPLALLRKNYLYNIIRKRWQCLHPDGTPMCIALEDSIILSMLRRLLGSMYGVLRTNFIIVTPDEEHVLGEFNRKFTLLDRYLLDLSDDPQRALDRRVAIALGVMLDTGERR